jgi:hypothetical protein
MVQEYRMKNTFQLIEHLMKMPSATRGISKERMLEEFSERTINKCINKGYIRFRNWDNPIGQGILIPTKLGEQYYDDIELDEKMLLTNKEENEL